MPQSEPSGPDLDGVVADADAVGLDFVVIGGFSVVANGYVRATRDTDLLVPDGPDADAAIAAFFERTEAKRLSDGARLSTEQIREAEHLRVETRNGIVDLLRGGAPPLDFDTVAKRAMEVEIGGRPARVASLRSVVAFKRLSDRPRDRNDLAELEAIHGELPIDPVPGLDD